MKLTRRALAAALAAAPALQAEPQQPAASEDLDATARTRMKNNVAALDTVKIPMSTEPAFQFKPL
jgi:hypothetical protein